MKLRRMPVGLILLLFQAFSTHSHSTRVAESTDTGPQLQPLAREAAPLVPEFTAIPDGPHIAAANIGTKDAPVDGKDGKPHAGPFVETAAERERKKAKESGEGNGVSTSTKPLPKPLKPPPSGSLHSEDSAIPVSNDGVMDDPNRASPKEGTRGTEGGVTEKDRDRKAQEGQIGAKPEKKPDPPKEAPPLPHDEEQKLTTKEEEEVGKKGKENAAEPERTKAVGGLEVSLLEDLSDIGGLILTPLVAETH